MYHRQGTPIVDRHDEIFDLMRKNANIGKAVKAGTTATIPIKTLLSNPLFAGVSGGLLEPSAFLAAMAVDKNQWNYKYNDDWRVPYDSFDGVKMDTPEANYRNWKPWMYFDGRLISADKFGNMNMSYVGKKMGLPEWVYKNFETMDDPEDIFWIDRGIEYANSGR